MILNVGRSKLPRPTQEQYKYRYLYPDVDKLRPRPTFMRLVEVDNLRMWKGVSRGTALRTLENGNPLHTDGAISRRQWTHIAYNRPVPSIASSYRSTGLMRGTYCSNVMCIKFTVGEEQAARCGTVSEVGCYRAHICELTKTTILDT